MNIAVNTRFLLKNKLEGIGWFTYETLKRITQNHPEHQFYFFFDRAYDEQFIFSDNVHPVVVHPQARHPVLFYLWFEWAIPRALKKVKADLFLSTDGFLSLKTKVPTTLVVHDIAYEHFPEDVSSIVLRYYKHFMPKFCAKANRIATVSEFTKQDVIKHYDISGDKIDVVYNGSNEAYRPHEGSEVDPVRGKYGVGENYFIYAGAIQPRKNVNKLFLAFDQFKKKTGSNAQLVIAGRKAWKFEDAMNIYNNMQFKDDVVLVGHLPVGDLAALTSGAKAMVYVSKFEGFGIPIVEAMNSDTAVITSNVSSMPEVAGDAALLIYPDSVDEIATSLGRIDEDENLRNQLIAKGRIQREKFGWDKTAENLWNVVKECVNN